MKYIKQHRLIQESRKGRTQSISLEDSISIFKNNCSDYDYKSPVIFRGIRNAHSIGEYNVIKPKEHKREGGYSNTTYLNLIDGSESWEKYPNRRESIICSTSKVVAGSFGAVYVVIPFDNAKFGVCPSYDFQQSFVDFRSMFGFNLHNIDSFLNIRYGATYDEIKKMILSGDYNSVELSSAYQQHISDNNISNEEIFKHILELTAPDRNGFKVVSQSELVNGDNLGHEAWTDSNCLLIKSTHYNNFLLEAGVEI